MRHKQIHPSTNHEALILVEGETEIEFYGLIAERFLKGKKKTTRNLGGTFNINLKVADRILQFHQTHPDNTFDVYVCVDQERPGYPIINPDVVRTLLEENKKWMGSDKLKELRPVIVVLMIESLFFIDIDGIYKYLKAPKSKRNPKKFSNFRQLTHRDLKTLFESFDNYYHKGARCKEFVASLDIKKIVATAEELSEFISNVKGS